MNGNNKLLEDGDYDFTVANAESVLCKNESSQNFGKPMLKLKLAIHDNGEEYFVYDYLLGSVKFKMEAFCKCVGLDQLLNHNEPTGRRLKLSDCQNKSGRVRIKTDVDPSGKYGPRNAVKKYIAAQFNNGNSDQNDFIDDVIDF